MWSIRTPFGIWTDIRLVPRVCPTRLYRVSRRTALVPPGRSPPKLCRRASRWVSVVQSGTSGSGLGEVGQRGACSCAISELVWVVGSPLAVTMVDVHRRSPWRPWRRDEPGSTDAPARRLRIRPVMVRGVDASPTANVRRYRQPRSADRAHFQPTPDTSTPVMIRRGTRSVIAIRLASVPATATSLAASVARRPAATVVRGSTLSDTRGRVSFREPIRNWTRSAAPPLVLSFGVPATASNRTEVPGRRVGATSATR